MDLRFPTPLQPGDAIGVTSPSSGVPETLRPRLEVALRPVEEAGFEVVVGECMDGAGHVSAPVRQRAEELQGFLVDPTIRAVYRPAVPNYSAAMNTATITACTDGDVPSMSEVVDLYDAVGWSAYTRDPSLLMTGLRGSLRVVVARTEGRLVGLARVVGDGATICYLQDVLVHPDARRQGLGRRLVHEAFAPYAAVRQHVLITDEEVGQKAFYESLGFSQFGAAIPGRTFVRFGG